MGSSCLFTRQQALKVGYFYWLRVKNSNQVLTELSLNYYQTFSFFKYVLYYTVLSKYLGKKSGVTVLVSSQTAVKGGHGQDG